MKFRYKVLITNLILLSVSLGLVGYLKYFIFHRGLHQIILNDCIRNLCFLRQFKILMYHQIAHSPRLTESRIKFVINTLYIKY